jgi:hypothetical protein
MDQYSWVPGIKPGDEVKVYIQLGTRGFVEHTFGTGWPGSAQAAIVTIYINDVVVGQLAVRSHTVDIPPVLALS